ISEQRLGDKQWSRALNWNPNLIPQTNDIVRIGNLPSAAGDATLIDTVFTIAGLELSNGASADTGGNFVDINGTLDVSGFASAMMVAEHGAGSTTTSLDVQNINIGAFSRVDLLGGRMIVAVPGPGVATSGLLTTNAGGTFSGWGQLRFQDGGLDGNITTQILNNGVFRARRDPSLAATERSTLHVMTTDTTFSSAFDWDGTTQNGIVEVMENVTLDLDLRALRGHGSVNLHAGSVFDSRHTFQLGNSGEIDVDASTTTAGVADTATLIAPLIDIESGASVNVDSGKFVMGPAQFRTGSSLNLAPNTTVRFGGNTTFRGNLSMSGTGVVLEIGDDTEINLPAFDWDGNETMTTRVTDNAFLLMNVNDLSPSAVDDSYDGTLIIDTGRVTVNMASDWTLSGELEMSGLSTGNARISGVPVHFDNADFRITNRFNYIEPVTTFTGSHRIDFGTEGTLSLLSDVTFNGGTIAGTGAGEIKFTSGRFTVAQPQVVDIPGGVFRMSQVTAPDSEEWNIDADLTVNARTLTVGDGGTFGSPSSEDDDSIRIRNGAKLELNLDGPWELGTSGKITIEGAGTDSTSLAGSDIEIEGAVFVQGDTRFDARIDLQETGFINGVGTLRLNGGSITNPNTINGGLFAVAGETLNAASGRRLVGHGRILNNINFDGSADLLARDGNLRLDGIIADADSLGTFDATGSLELIQPLDTANINRLNLNGGSVDADDITNNSLISGHGQITTTGLINNADIVANGGTLIVSSPNAVDLDGAGINGDMTAVDGNITIDAAITDHMGGVYQVGNLRTLRFKNGWTLGTNGTLQLSSTNSPARVTSGAGMWLRGNLNIDGRGEISSAGVTTLDDQLVVNLPANDDNLTIIGNTVVEAGIVFNGTGQFTHGDGIIDLDDGVTMMTRFRSSDQLNLDGNAIAEVQIADLTLLGTSNSTFDLASLSSFDQIEVFAEADIAGSLTVNLAGGFQPSFGDAFNIIFAAGTVGGQFASTNLPTLGNDLAWSLEYDSASVVLRVIQAMVSGDFDDNGIYDLADIDGLVAAIASGSGDLAFDLTGDGMLDTMDLDAWLAEAGAANLPSGGSYLYGDANLDGSVDVSDFNLWNTNKFTATAAWSGADFNADGFVDVSDFNTWNANKFQSADSPAAVPEPTGTVLLLFGIAAMAFYRRKPMHQ
ncbi:MAG: PEP-CTERM sorting domain-containing protein, partial [Planctomycetota bacterium]